MPHTRRAGTELSHTLDRVARDRLLELELDELTDLLIEPDVRPFQPRRSPYRSGIEDLVLTLSAADRLPDTLTVRVILPDDRHGDGDGDELVALAQSAFHARAADMTNEAWRDAMAIRSMGRRQLPLGIATGISAAVAAYVAGYLAAVVETAAVRGALVVVAMIALTIAWVVGWVVVEAAVLDWRLPARRAAACQLLELATIDIAYQGETSSTP